METSGEQPRFAAQQVSELMKNLTLGIVGDLGRMLREQGLGHRPIRILELVMFGMFMVTEAFVTHMGLEEGRASLDQFHEDMIAHMFSEFIFKHQKAKDLEEVQGRFQELNSLINQRYREYRRWLSDDVQDRHNPFRQTFTALWANISSEPLPAQEELNTLLTAFSRNLARFWTGCMASFPPKSA
jgi:hypothetical protein